jgi:SAM-dependent methyltransferase
MAQLIQRLKGKVRPPLPLFRWLNRRKEQFTCPICRYEGPFRDLHGFAGPRQHAQCPQCGSLERHRLQYFVVTNLFRQVDTRKMKMLHVAPEKFFQPYFSKWFGQYETADLCMKNVDHRVDLQQLPFPDGSYDFIFASHVLEHIPDDGKAIREIRRVLKPGGFAVLPVPVVCHETVEYPEANPNEAWHFRAPGLDYFERYRKHFDRVELQMSDALPEQFQLFVYEDRSVWPTAACPLRPPMPGLRHADVVPICYA